MGFRFLRSRRRAILLGVASTILLAGAVAASAPTPTVGPLYTGFGSSRPVLMTLEPDFVPVWGRAENIAGYVRQADLDGQQTVIPVYGADLTTIVGHMVPDKGFVPVGVDPQTIPDFPVQAGPSGAAVSPGN